MLPSIPVRRNSTEEDDFLALARALNWRAAPPLPWNSLAGSLAVHVVAMLLFVSVFPGPPGEAPVSERPDAVVQSFVPLAFPAPPAPKEAVLRAGGRLAPAPIELPDATASNVTVNLNSIQLSIAVDLGNQLPGVVETQHGMLALVDKEDLGVARYLMQPPNWRPRSGMTDISRRLRFKMEPPRKWPVFRQVADRYGIDLDRFVGCAVFDAAFGKCLKAAIRSRLSPDATGPVSSVRLAFAADHPCGIEVLEVSLAGKPAPKP
jgi:hypothetical protein